MDTNKQKHGASNVEKQTSMECSKKATTNQSLIASNVNVIFILQIFVVFRDTIYPIASV